MAGHASMGPTRRAVLASLAVSSLQGATKQEPVRLPREVRLGLIGFEGHTGELLDPLPLLPDVKLVAVATADEASRKEFAVGPRAMGVQVYEDYRRMLDHERLDVVGVCNNDGERAAAILECARRNLHIVAEKPLAIRWSDFREVRKAASESRGRLTMLLPMRFSSPYLAMKQVVDSGEIGEVAQISAQKSYKLGNRPEWFRHRSSYGSTMLWIGIHMVDLMRWTSGRELTAVASFESRVGFPELGDMENVTGALFRLDNGGIGTLHMDYLRPETSPTHGDDRLRLAGMKGVVEYMNDPGLLVLSQRGKQRQMRDLPEEFSLFVDFLRSVYEGKTPALSLADIYRTNEIVLTARDASERNSVMKI